MLILNRELGETVMIGTDIKVTILGVQGNRVCLGFVADRSTIIDRLELFARKQLKAAVRKSSSKGSRREPKAQTES
jgi:carbon storage regulator